jgi:hypothetical protein
LNGVEIDIYIFHPKPWAYRVEKLDKSDAGERKKERILPRGMPKVLGWLATSLVLQLPLPTRESASRTAHDQLAKISSTNAIKLYMRAAT